MKLIRLGWDWIQPDSSHLIYFTSRIWSRNELWAKDRPEKAIWVLFTWTVLQTHKSPLQFRWATHSERRGYVFHSKDKSRMLPGILKDSGSTWQPDLELMISREIFNESEFLIISKVQKLTQSSWEQSGAGKVQSPGSSYNPIPTEIWAVLLCKTLLQKRSSIEKKIHLQWAEQSLPTESCQFSCD